MTKSDPIIIYPPTIDWDHMHQRPQQMMKAFAALGVTAIFCNTNTEGKRPFSMQQIGENLILANNLQLEQTVSWVKAVYPGRKIIIYYSYPAQVHIVHNCGADMVIFDSLDEPVDEFSHWMNEYTMAATRADLVLASAVSLKERAQALRQDEVLYVPNACDYEHFVQANKKVDVPELRGMKPIIGFVGAVASWLDWGLIEKMARELTQHDFVFVGSLYDMVGAPVQLPNAHYLGHKDYSELPKYISNFDFCFIPFKITSMTKGVSPIKYWEYLATGKPVLSTALPEVVNTGLATIIDQDNCTSVIVSDKNKEMRQGFAKENNWQSRAEAVIECLK